MSEPLQDALLAQGRVCAHLGSPFSGALLERAAGALASTAGLQRLLSPWDAASFAEAMTAAVPLRLLGAMHDLALSGEAPELFSAWPGPGRSGDVEAAWRAAAALLETRGQALAAFMAHEPQTNEVQRSAGLIGGFLTIAETFGLPLSVIEVGASAGLNLLFDTFTYRLGDVGFWGAADAGLELQTDWRGPPPPLDAPLRVARRAACDRRPVDIAAPLARRRLRAYVWAGQIERLARLDTALALAQAAGLRVETAEAATFVAERARPVAGIAMVVWHSIVWQYLDLETKEALGAAITAHGEQASNEAPLAWLRMEPPDGSLAPAELRLTTWPGGVERLLARVHPHGAWVEWLGGA